MALFVPCTAGFQDAVKNPLSARFLKVLIDSDGDGDLEDVTSYLDNNQVSGGGKGQGALGVSTKEYTVQLRNSALGLVDGAWVGRPCAIEAKVGTAEYIRIFTGFISEEGAQRSKASITEDVVVFTMQDASYSRGMRRKPKPVNYVNYKICDTVTPANSLFHKLAYQLGLADADLETATINQTKDYLPLDGRREVWQELQDLCAQYIGHMVFRYDGKLRFISRHQQGWAEPSIEWTFDTDNIRPWHGKSTGIACNRCRTDFEKYENLGPRVIYKNTDQWNATYKWNDIPVAAGAYWPGSNAADKAQLRYKDPASGEDWPVGINITTPTIGAYGSGSDIECEGGLLILVSFNGSTGATQQNPESSEIILRNNTGGTVVIRKLEVRGTPLRVQAKIVVEDVDGTVTDDWKFVDKTIPGKYAVSDTQAHLSTQRWVEFGKVDRKEFDFETYWLPQIQEGAVVTFNPDGSINISAVVESFKHTCEGSPRRWKTRIIIREKEAFTPSGAAKVITQAQGQAETEKADITAAEIAARPTYTEVQQGYTQGGGTKTPTQVTISVCKPVAVKAIRLQWDRQLNLTNLDHYDVQVSDDQVNWYSLKFDGTDWKDQLGGLTASPFEEMLHPNIPHGGTAEAPVGRTLYYHVRRAIKVGDPGAWSAVVSATTKTVAAGDVATDTLYASNVKASEIATFLLRALSAVIIGQDYEGSPPAGAQRVVCDNNEFRLEEWDGSAWQTILRLGGDDMLKWYLSCRGVIKTGADLSGVEIGDLAPAGSKVFDFENDYKDKAEVDPWDEKAGSLSFSGATKKFGSYSLTGDWGWISDWDANGVDFGNPFGIDAWLRLGTLPAAGVALDLVGLSTSFSSATYDEQSAQYFDADYPYGYLRMIRLNEIQFVLTYRESFGSFYNRVVVGTLGDNGTITWGTPVTVATNYSDRMGMGRLADNKFVLLYVDSSDYHLKAILGTVSGSTITLGTASEVVAARPYTQSFDLCAMASDKILVVWADQSDNNHGWARAATISGDTFTWGTAAEFSGAEANGGRYAAVEKLDTDKAVIGYCLGTSLLGKGIIATLSGTTLSFGTAATFQNTGVDHINIAALSTSKFCFSYRSSGDGKLYAVIGDVSGTTITFGAASLASDTLLGGPNDVIVLDSSTIMVAWATSNTGWGYRRRATISGTTFTWDSAVGNYGTDGGTITLAVITTGAREKRMVICYADSHGYPDGFLAAVQLWQRGTYLRVWVVSTGIEFDYFNSQGGVGLLRNTLATSGGAQHHVSINNDRANTTFYYTVDGAYASRSFAGHTQVTTVCSLYFASLGGGYACFWDDLLVLPDVYLNYSTGSIAHYNKGQPWVDPNSGIDVLLDLFFMAKGAGKTKFLSPAEAPKGLAVPTLHVQDQKASGTAGGGFTSGAWQTRILNTVVTNTITGASLSSNQITLPAGTYEIMARAPAFNINYHKAALYNVTGSTYLLYGSNSFNPPGGYSETDSFVYGRFTLAAQSALELRHQCTTTRGTDGFGLPCSYGVIEIYAEVIIRKVA